MLTPWLARWRILYKNSTDRCAQISLLSPFVEVSLLYLNYKFTSDKSPNAKRFHLVAIGNVYIFFPALLYLVEHITLPTGI